MKKPSKTQKIILFAGFFVFLLINLFPPWVAFLNPPDYNESIGIGYGFVLSPPLSKFGYQSFVVINYTRLFIQWGILIGIILTALIITAKKSP